MWTFAGPPGATRSLRDHGHSLTVVIADKADPFTLPTELRATVAADDLVADVRGAPADASVCALAISKKLLASAPVATLVTRLESEVPGCAAIPAAATAVVVPVPAIRRAPR